MSAFIAILLVIRFQEIACFAASGASLKYIGLFTLYQIPYILPIAIPISCLIGAMILFQKLSHTHELTALRTSGLGLLPIAQPLLLAGVLMSLLNLTITSEVTPYAKRLSKQLMYQITSENPLVLLQKDTLIKLKNSYIDLKTLDPGKSAEDVIFIAKQSSSQRLGIMTAKELLVKNGQLLGKNVSFISSMDSKLPTYDHLILENQHTMQTEVSTLMQYLHNSELDEIEESSSLRDILAKETIEKPDRSLRISKGAQVEISRRITLGLSPFTFTLIGVAFGMDISRHKRKKGVLWAFGLASFFMISFVAAKSFRHTPHFASISYILPHFLICALCLYSFRAIEKGVE